MVQIPAYTTTTVAEFVFPSAGIARIRLVGAFAKNLGDYTYDQIWVWLRPGQPLDVPNTSVPSSMAGWWMWSRSDTDRPTFRVPEGSNLYVYRPAPTWDPAISYFLACSFEPNDRVGACGGVQ